MPNLILVRHGQSRWNLENRFTGWTDVDLSPKGAEEADAAGEAILKSGIVFDIAYVSVLRRAIETLHRLEKKCGLEWVPEVRSWRLNERHYGALQGLDKAETAKKYGEEQVHTWRRSFDIPPPLLKADDPRAPRFEPQYKKMDARLLPLGESLKQTIDRVLPLWEDSIAPSLLEGKNVIIAAHGNSLRGLCKFLEGISDADIAKLEIPTGVPQIYELRADLSVKKRYYLY